MLWQITGTENDDAMTPGSQLKYQGWMTGVPVCLPLQPFPSFSIVDIAAMLFRQLYKVATDRAEHTSHVTHRKAPKITSDTSFATH